MSTFLFDEPPLCPDCGTPNPLPIIYGPASNEMRTAAKLGDIILSGQSDCDPARQWMCQDPHCALSF